MTQRKHVFSITLLARGTTALRMEGRKRLERWATYRYNLLLDGTLQSIANQSAGPSPTLIRADARYKWLVDKLASSRPLPDWAVFVYESPLLHLSKRLQESSEEPWDFLYLTRVDSDDLFHSNAKQHILNTPVRYRSAIFQTGYLYNSKTKALTVYHHPSPPFHTDIFSRQEVVNRQWPRRKSHNTILPGGVRKLPNWMYTVVCHSDFYQDSSTWNKLRKSVEGRLRSGGISGLPPALPNLGNLADFGCPHYKIGTVDHMTYSRYSGGGRWSRTPAMRRMRYSPQMKRQRSTAAPQRRTRPRVSSVAQQKPVPKKDTAKVLLPHYMRTRNGLVAINQPAAERPRVDGRRSRKPITTAKQKRKPTPAPKQLGKHNKINQAQDQIRSPKSSRSNVRRRMKNGERLRPPRGYKILKDG